MANTSQVQLRRSGRLVGPSMEALSMPHEDECTLFETASKIERHGCRTVISPVAPERGIIDQHVDDFAAYQVCTACPHPLAAPARALATDSALSPLTSSCSSLQITGELDDMTGALACSLLWAVVACCS